MKSGFTLIELLVVISIIGILSALLLANMVGIRERGRDTKVKNDLNQLKTALRLYYNDNQSYPLAADWVDCSNIPGVNAAGVFQNAAGTTIYMRDVPSSGDVECTYQSRDNGESFLLRATLRNSGDKDIQASAARCDGPSPAPGETYYYECTD